MNKNCNKFCSWRGLNNSGAVFWNSSRLICSMGKDLIWNHWQSKKSLKFINWLYSSQNMRSIRMERLNRKSHKMWRKMKRCHRIRINLKKINKFPKKNRLNNKKLHPKASQIKIFKLKNIKNVHNKSTREVLKKDLNLKIRIKSVQTVEIKLTRKDLKLQNKILRKLHKKYLQ